MVTISKNSRSRELYTQRKLQGLCVRCGKANQNGKSQCDLCTTKRREYDKNRYQNTEHCEKRRKAVREHYSRNTEAVKRRARRYRKSKAAREIRNKTDQIRRENRKIDGLCPRCGKPTKKFVHCRGCRSRVNARNRKRRARLP